MTRRSEISTSGAVARFPETVPIPWWQEAKRVTLSSPEKSGAVASEQSGERPTDSDRPVLTITTLYFCSFGENSLYVVKFKKLGLGNSSIQI